jgi:hypothetical protein
MTQNGEYIKDALIRAELQDPVQNIIDLTDHIFETIDGFNTELSIFDLQNSIGKLKKYHEFNKILVEQLQKKQ